MADLALILSAIKSIKFKGTGFMFYPANKVIKDIIIIFIVCALAAFVAEIVDRGIIFNQLMQFEGEVSALIIGSLIFTMFHTGYYHRLI
jgi:membrane protease YdiL (CAAX protease family)